MKRFLALALVALVAACGTTAAEREAWRDTGLNFALVAVDTIRDLGVNPVGSSDTALKIANAGCTMIAAGTPIILVAINQRIAEANADPNAEPTELLTLDEMMASLDAACEVIRAIVEPAPDVVAA